MTPTDQIVRRSRLARLVKARRGTQALRDAAQAAGVSAATLSRVERGQDPDIDTFTRLCEWLRVSPNEALGWTQAGYVDEGMPCRLLLVQSRLLETLTDLTGIIEGAIEDLPRLAEGARGGE